MGADYEAGARGAEGERDRVTAIAHLRVRDARLRHDDHCITCGDVAEPMRVLRIDAERELALCADAGRRASHGRDRARPAGRRSTTSCSSTRGRRSREVRRRVPRRRARPGAGRRDPRERRAGPPLQADGGLRRPHPLDLQVRDRRPAPRQRRARPRPRLPGLRDPDGPGRRRDRPGARARRDPHLLRRHDAGAGLRRHLPRREGRRARHPHGLLAARRAADREAEPRPHRRLLRDRLRDHGALDGADPEAGEGRGRRELPLHVQPRDDRAAAAGAARVARPAARRLHRPRPRVDDRRRAAVRVHPRRLRQAAGHRGLRAARHPAVDPDDPRASSPRAAARSRTSTRASSPTRATSRRCR